MASYISLKLAALGHQINLDVDSELLEIARPVLRNWRQRDLMAGDRPCPADSRILSFLNDYLKGELPARPQLIPSSTFLLDRAGLARELPLPMGGNEFSSPYLKSYRVKQGILHNPKSDRRTTKGIFHIVEGGLPAPGDKLAVPKNTFAALDVMHWTGHTGCVILAPQRTSPHETKA